MAQLDPVTPLSVGAAAAWLHILKRFSLLSETLTDCMIFTCQMLHLAPWYKGCVPEWQARSK